MTAYGKEWFYEEEMEPRCVYVDRSPLWGRPPQYDPAPFKLTFDLNFDLESEMSVFLCLSLLHLGPMYATDRPVM